MGKKKVLVVDDELDVRIFVCTLLGTCGYRTLVASTEGEGIRKAREHQPDLIVMDVMMSRKSGIRLYRKLKTDESLKDIPVIMLSDIAKRTFFRSQNVLGISMQDGVREPDAYIEKPLESDELLHWARQLLGSRGSGTDTEASPSKGF